MILAWKINIILAILIFMLILKIIGDNNHNHYKPFNSVWVNETYENVKNLLINTQKCLEKLNIDFIPMYGTLLGLVRHKGLIPWDDVIDISIDKKYFDVIIKNKNVFNDHGLDIFLYKYNNRVTFIKIFYLHKKKIKNHTWSWPFIDIFAYYEKDNKFYVENKEELDYEFNTEDFMPFKTNLFENIPMNMPNNVDIVLNKLYGNDWENTCYSSSFDHKNHKIINNKYKINCDEILNDSIEDIFNNVWVINLKRRPDRLNTTVNRLQKIGIIPKVYNAIDSKSEEVIDCFKNIKGSKLSISEYACYLSHKTLWMYIYSLNIPYAIIFEDDVIFEDNIRKEDITERIKDSKGFNILFLGHCYSDAKYFKNPLTIVGSALCLHAYVITRHAIKKLLDNNESYLHPIDIETKKFCKKELCYLSNTLSPNNFGDGIVKQENHYYNSDLIRKNFFLMDMMF